MKMIQLLCNQSPSTCHPAITLSTLCLILLEGNYCYSLLFQYQEVPSKKFIDCLCMISHAFQKYLITCSLRNF